MFNVVLRNLRAQKGITQKQLAEELSLDTSSISKYEGDNDIFPSKEIIEKIADYFDVSIDYLYGRELQETEALNYANWVTVPVYGMVAGGTPIEAEQNIVGEIRIDPKYANSDNYIVLQIQGDSMAEKISDGDYVVIHKQSDVESNQIAVLYVNGYNATCKKVRKHNNGISLIPLNTAYEAEFYTNEEVESLPIVIHGRVVQSISNY